MFYDICIRSTDGIVNSTQVKISQVLNMLYWKVPVIWGQINLNSNHSYATTASVIRTCCIRKSVFSFIKQGE